MDPPLAFSGSHSFTGSGARWQRGSGTPFLISRVLQVGILSDQDLIIQKAKFSRDILHRSFRRTLGFRGRHRRRNVRKWCAQERTAERGGINTGALGPKSLPPTRAPSSFLLLCKIR
eukprot:757080-Amorphochlora_amoeboformis.AAC.1